MLKILMPSPALLQVPLIATHLGAYSRFLLGLRRPEQTQNSILKKRTGLSYQDFVRKFPPTTYADWKDYVESLRANKKNSIRFEPTSGSTYARKWIPYTQDFTTELNEAASAWLCNLAKLHPKVYFGKHYWSLSWIPTELRNEISSTDDSEFFTPIKRYFMKNIFAVPTEVSKMKTLDESFFATLTFLASTENLSLLSVWSPTFGIELMRRLRHQKNEIATTLATGKWPENLTGALKAPKNERAARILFHHDENESIPELTKKLWPNLALTSAWDSSTSSHWAQELKNIFPHSKFQGKGLWATEGVVTIPFNDSYPLAITSHFLEFRDLDTNKIHPSWNLKKGQIVSPLITTGSGFLRYELSDKLLVDGFLENTPTLKFIERLGSSDLVGEKIDSGTASAILREIERKFEVDPVSMIACKSGDEKKPQYVILLQGDQALTCQISDFTESLLLNHHHYKLARELGQLSSCKAHIRNDALEAYYGWMEKRGQITGSCKIEPLIILNEI